VLTSESFSDLPATTRTDGAGGQETRLTFRTVRSFPGLAPAPNPEKSTDAHKKWLHFCEYFITALLLLLASKSNYMDSRGLVKPSYGKWFLTFFLPVSLL